jgi:hypothetical protein
MLRAGVLLVLFATGCSCSSTEVPPQPAADSAPPVAVPDPPAQDPNWRAKYGLPEEIDPKKVSFAKPADGETFLKLDAAARKVANTNWEKRAGDRYPYSFWNAGSDGFYQTYSGVWEKVANPARGPAAKPNHTINLSTTLYAGNPPTASGFSLRADRNPKNGWGVRAEFTISESKNSRFENFILILRHDEHAPVRPDAPSFSGLILHPAQVSFSVSPPEDRFDYQFLVSSQPGGVAVMNRKPLGREIARYWSSADSFRDVVLEDLDRLEANVKDGIPSGKLAKIMTKGGPTGANPPQPVTNKEAGPPGTLGEVVPDAIKGAALKQALAEIENRKKLVKEYYKDMYATVTAAFPGLGEILEPPEKK